MSKKGKNKGSRFEREICKSLSLWISEGRKKDLFWRSAMSGGRATVFQKKGELLKNQSGDISSISQEGMCLTNALYIECKFYKNLQLSSFFLNRKGNLYKFWKETIRQANIYKKIPFLIAKQNNQKTILLTTQKINKFLHVKVRFRKILINSNTLIFVFEDILKNTTFK